MSKQTFTSGQVLSAAQMTTLQQTAMLGGAANARVASYTLVAADAGDAITMNNASATTITVNTGLFAAGDIVTILNIGTGVCTITAGTATVTTSGSLALSQNQGGILRFTSASAAIFLQFATPGGGLKAMTLLNAGGTTLTGSSTVTVSGISNQQALLVLLDGASCTGASQIGIRINGISTSNYRQLGIQAEANVNNQLNALTGRWIMGDTGGAAETLMGGCIIYGTGAAGIMAMHGTGIAGGTGRIGNASTGYFDAAAAVTSISASANSNFDAGTMFIYGMSA